MTGCCASGVPDSVDWQAAAEEALSIVLELSEGTAIMRNTVLELSGKAADADAFHRAQAVLSHGFSSGVSLGSADIDIADDPASE